jgi:uncharacterized protein (TIGR01777 family)
VTGATGLIGSALTRLLRSDGISVFSIGRGPESDIRWNPEHDELDAKQLEGFDAVVHLAGAPIDVRWSQRHKREIRDSRVRSTQLLSHTLARVTRKPRVLVSGSAVGFYGNRGSEILTEDSAGGEGFLADVVREWEGATRMARDAGIRVINIRTGVVVSGTGGMLSRLLLPFKLGLGGPIGGGRQWMSWIALHDHIRAVRFAFTNTVAGPLNLVSPEPVTNAEFTRALGRVLSRPTVIPLPGLALRAAYGQMAVETILTSQRAVPARLQASSFRFEEPEIEHALRRELASRGS